MRIKFVQILLLLWLDSTCLRQISYYMFCEVIFYFIIVFGPFLFLSLGCDYEMRKVLEQLDHN